MTRILVFGDSITCGAYDYEEGGWINRLRKFLDTKVLVDRKLYIRIYNLGVSGDSTEDLLKRFESETKARIREAEDNIIIFQIGMNDSIIVMKGEKLVTPINEFRENIEKLIKLSKKFTEKSIFIGLSPVNESRVNPIPWWREASYRNDYIRKYDAVIKSACRANNVDLIEMLDEFRIQDYDKYLENGVYPNAEGHQKMFEVIKDFLIEKKII